MKDKTITLSVAQLIEDFTIYPRVTVDPTHVHYLAEAIEADTELPPPVVEDKTWRIVDGLHRTRAFRQVYGDEAKLRCIVRTYPSDTELLHDAGKLNSSHGRTMTKRDRAHFIARAQELQMDEESIADALHMKVDKIGAFKDAYTATGQNGMSVVLKKPVLYMAGKTLTKAQVDVLPKLGGQAPTFYVNQLIHLMENNMIDRDNETVMTALKALSSKLSHFLEA